MHEPDAEDWAVGHRAAPVARALIASAQTDMGTDSGALTALVGASLGLLKHMHPEWTDSKRRECLDVLIGVFMEHELP